MRYGALIWSSRYTVPLIIHLYNSRNTFTSIRRRQEARTSCAPLDMNRSLKKFMFRKFFQILCFIGE
jgi:hypothetical protein